MYSVNLFIKRHYLWKIIIKFIFYSLFIYYMKNKINVYSDFRGESKRAMK